MTTLAASIISLFGMASLGAKATQVVVVRKSRVSIIPSISFLPLGVLHAITGGLPPPSHIRYPGNAAHRRLRHLGIMESLLQVLSAPSHSPSTWESFLHSQSDPAFSEDMDAIMSTKLKREAKSSTRFHSEIQKPSGMRSPL